MKKRQGIDNEINQNYFPVPPTLEQVLLDLTAWNINWQTAQAMIQAILPEEGQCEDLLGQGGSESTLSQLCTAIASAMLGTLRKPNINSCGNDSSGLSFPKFASQSTGMVISASKRQPKQHLLESVGTRDLE